jgi:long-chain acyl-CoA synthetase
MCTYPRDGARSPLNLATNLIDTAAIWGDSAALKHDDTEFSYAQLDDVSARVAGLLVGSGVEPGDRVGLMLPNVAWFPPIYYGALLTGAVVVPINPRGSVFETRFLLEDSKVSLVLAWHKLADVALPAAGRSGATCVFVEPDGFWEVLVEHEPLLEAVRRAEEDVAVHAYGSDAPTWSIRTELTHGTLAATAERGADMLKLEPDNTVLPALPMFFSSMQGLMNATVVAGARMTLLQYFDADKALDVIERDEVTLLAGHPAMHRAVDRARAERSSNGGMRLPKAIDGPPA